FIYFYACMLIRTRPPPCSTVFPYTTLFRSSELPTFARWLRRSVRCRPPMHPTETLRTTRSTDCFWCKERSGQAAPCWSSRWTIRSEEHTSELQSRENLVCRLLLEKKQKTQL